MAKVKFHVLKSIAGGIVIPFVIILFAVAIMSTGLLSVIGWENHFGKIVRLLIALPEILYEAYYGICLKCDDVQAPRWPVLLSFIWSFLFYTVLTYFSLKWRNQRVSKQH